MNQTAGLIIGAANGIPIQQLGSMSNRHGLVAGATGTGKTVTLQILAEGFSRMGVPVFAADIKGDLSGLAAVATPNPKIEERLRQIPLPDYAPSACPVAFWDIYGETGHPIRTTVSEMGPLLLTNLLDLNDTQSGLLYACFRIADDQGLLLLDLKDLRAMLAWMSDHARDLRPTYGNISAASIGAIQRQLLVLEEQGGNLFFGEPALQLNDLLHVDFSGRGVVSILDATRLVAQSPRIYATFLLWLLSELFEQLPEAGDANKPRLVFFFDEAHLFFFPGTQGPGRKDRTGRTPDSLQGRGGLFRHPEPSRHPGQCARSVGHENPACPARLHPQGSAGGRHGGPNFSAQSAIGYCQRHHHPRHRRSTGLDSRPAGTPPARRTHPDLPAAIPHRPTNR